MGHPAVCNMEAQTQLLSNQLQCCCPKKRLLNPILLAQAKRLSHQQPIYVQTRAASWSCPCILMNSSQGSNYKVSWHLRHLRCHKNVFLPKDPYFITDSLCCCRLSAFFLVHSDSWNPLGLHCTDTPETGGLSTKQGFVHP